MISRVNLKGIALFGIETIRTPSHHHSWNTPAQCTNSHTALTMLPFPYLFCLVSYSSDKAGYPNHTHIRTDFPPNIICQISLAGIGEAKTPSSSAPSPVAVGSSPAAPWTRATPSI